MRRKGRGHMTKTVLKALAVAAALLPAVGFAQGSKPTSATYITDEEVKAVNALPGVDRTIKVVDIGSENYAIGVIHRGATGAAARGTGGAGGGGAAGGGAGGSAGTGGGAGGRAGGPGGSTHGEQRGDESTAALSTSTPRMIPRDHQSQDQ